MKKIACEQLNIIIFAAADFPEGPATTSRIKLISKILEVAGHNVSLAIFHANAKKSIATNSCTHGNYNSIEFKYLNGRTVRPPGLIGAIFDTLRGIKNSIGYLKNKRKNKQADIVIFYTPGILTILPCLIMTIIYKIPVILELCEIFSTMKNRTIRSRIRLIGAKKSEDFLSRVSTGIIPISTKIISYLKQYGVEERKMFHLPILVDYKQFENKSKTSVEILSGKQYFLNSGALGDKEGVDFIMEAFSNITMKHKHIYLVFTGDPDNERKKSVLDMAKKLNFGEYIIFTGFLLHEQLVWAYQNALALLCCRSNSDYANFGFPTKLAEYLSTGRPVITNEVGDISLYLKDQESAFIAKSEDSVSIMEQMERIIIDQNHALSVGLKGQKIAREHFDYINYGSSLNSFIMNCVNTKLV